ncbi:MAG: peptidoglycan-binding domain-containing protein [Candidatus Omnitrophota bacterium]
MFLRLLCIAMLVIGISGCATAKKSASSSQIEEFNGKISDLEKQLQEKDSEIRDLEDRLSRTQGVEEMVNVTEVDISSATPIRIQTALKNAGFYNEAVDGKLGRKTKEAIKAFQKENSLKADGVVGKQTWSKLQKFLGQSR